MVGQDKIISFIDKAISTNTFPRTLLLEGEQGCGKHHVVNLVCEKLNLDLNDITDSLNLETLDQITLSPLPKVYLINAQEITVKEQNVILKFLEEPLKNSYIILIIENKSLLLETVVNRCVCLPFEKYTNEQLVQICGDDIPKYANTPGRVEMFRNHPVTEMEQFARSIFTNVRVANYSNILRIPNRINFKDESDKFDYSIFIYILLNVANDMYKESLIKFGVYELTNRFYNDSRIPHINKVHLFENFIIRLKQAFEREQ